MADSKWIDPWALSVWTNTALNVKIDPAWTELKGAADERQALVEFDHSTGFDADNTFPDLSAAISKFLSGPSTPNNAVKILNAVWPVDIPETDDFQTSGVVTANSPANLFTLSEILTDEFGYASGTLLHISDTDSGTDTAKLFWAWVIQWFQVLDYPVYYLRRLKNNATGNAFYSVLEVQEVEVEVTYNYVVSPFAFTSATNFVTKRTSGAIPVPVDVYVANDLSEAGAASTPQQVRDYAITTWGNNNSTWWAAGHDLGDKDNYAQLIEDNTSLHFAGPFTQTIVCTLRVHRVRFKTNDDYRVASPDRYDTPKYWNGYYTGSSQLIVQIPVGSPTGTPPTIASYSDFGTGEVNNDVQLNLMVEDGGDYYNLEVASPDFDDEPVIGFPPDPGFNAGVSRWEQTFMLQLLQLEAGTTLSAPFKQTDPTTGVNDVPSQINNVDTSIYVKANTDDGLNFEWYTPAP